MRDGIDDNSLKHVCTARVYLDNPFHLLGVPTTATPRQIRRRMEDLESAHALGGAAWTQEFRGHLWGGEVPSIEAVREACERLSDPASRLLSEFFWVWPLPGQDKTPEAFACGDTRYVRIVWKSVAEGEGLRRAIAWHNLAILHHSAALALENVGWLMLVARSGLLEDHIRKLEIFWHAAFHYWAQVENDTWSWTYLRQRAEALGYENERIIDLLQEQFRAWLLGVTMQVALRYMDEGLQEYALRVAEEPRRHGLEVEMSVALAQAFAKRERQVEVFIARQDARLNEDKANGKTCLLQLLADCETIRQAVILLAGGRGELRVRIDSSLYWACERYLVAYGNATGIWQDCTGLNRLLEGLACTQETRARWEEDEAILQRNAELEAPTEVCLLCGRHHARCGKYFWGATVLLHKNARRLPTGQIKGEVREVSFPCCKVCYNRLPLALKAGERDKEPGLFRVWPSGPAEECSGRAMRRRLKDFPPIAALLRDGWLLEEIPTDDTPIQSPTPPQDGKPTPPKETRQDGSILSQVILNILVFFAVLFVSLLLMRGCESVLEKFETTPQEDLISNESIMW